MNKQLPSGVITVMFTDMVAATELKRLMPGRTSAVRDEQFRAKIKEPHDAVIYAIVSEHAGKRINPTGDGFCFAFSDPEEAVYAAIEIQESLLNSQIETPRGRLQIRVGLHTGYALATGQDIISTTVDKAARVQAQSKGSEVLLSTETRALVREKLHDISIDSAGIVHLRGIGLEELFIAYRENGGIRKQMIPSIDERAPHNVDLSTYSQYWREQWNPFLSLRTFGGRVLSVSGVYTRVRLATPEIRFRYASVEQLESLYGKVSRQDELLDALFDGDVLASEQQYLVVLGEPGSGKSVFLRHLALAALNNEPLAHGCVPVFLSLAQELEQTGSFDLHKSIQRAFYRGGIGDSERFLKTALKEGKLLLLLDGLDEVPKDVFDEVVSCVKRFVRDDNNIRCRFVISCRTAFYGTKNVHLGHRFTDVIISPLSDLQIREFIQKRLPADEAAQLTHELFENSGHKQTLELAMTPLLLDFICLVFDQWKALPTRRSKLLSDAIDILMQVWNEEKGVHWEEPYPGLTPRLEKTMLSSIAATALTKDKTYSFFNQDSLCEEIEGFIKKSKLKGGSSDHSITLKQMEKKHGLILERAHGVFSFSHAAIQEFFISNHVAKMGLDRVSLTKHLVNPAYREIFLLAMELPSSGRLLRKMAEMGKELGRELVVVHAFFEKVCDSSESDIHRRTPCKGYQKAISLAAAISPLMERSLGIARAESPRDLHLQTAFNLSMSVLSSFPVVNRRADYLYGNRALYIDRSSEWSDISAHFEEYLDSIDTIEAFSYDRIQFAKESLRLSIPDLGWDENRLACGSRLIEEGYRRVWQALADDGTLIDTLASTHGLVDYLTANKLIVDCCVRFGWAESEEVWSNLFS